MSFRLFDFYGYIVSNIKYRKHWPLIELEKDCTWMTAVIK